MAELIILGSGSGFATQDRFCTSLALMAGDSLYLFDCGEPCGALLFRQGIDPLALKGIFTSHMHPDHIGGLANLLFSIYLAARSGTNQFRPWSIHRNAQWYRSALWFPPLPKGTNSVAETRPEISLVLPSEALEPIQAYLTSVYLAPSLRPFELHFLPVKEGLTFADSHLHVTALPNTHMSANFAYDHLRAEHPQLQLQSYSYAAEVEGKKIVFSGDITTLDELNPLLQGAVLLIIEVAHYDPKDIGPFVKNLKVGQIVLTHIHPGLESLLVDLVAEWQDPRISIAHDGLRIPLN